MHLKVCYLHPSKSGIEMRRDTLRLLFLDQMCTRDDEKISFWKQDAKTGFQFLRRAHLAEEEVKICTKTSEPSTENVVMI